MKWEPWKASVINYWTNLECRQKCAGNILPIEIRIIDRCMFRMGFHIPPYNSVNHLHLHVQGLPYKSLAKKAKYPVASGYGYYHKGFSWFVDVSQAIQILENGGRVGVFPCWTDTSLLRQRIRIWRISISPPIGVLYATINPDRAVCVGMNKVVQVGCQD